MKRWLALNEIHAGICEGLTYADVRVEYPYIEKLRKEDKYAFRYPQVRACSCCSCCSVFP